MIAHRQQSPLPPILHKHLPRPLPKRRRSKHSSRQSTLHSILHIRLFDASYEGPEGLGEPLTKREGRARGRLDRVGGVGFDFGELGVEAGGGVGNEGSCEEVRLG